MIEIPEAAIISDQINERLVGKTIDHVITNHSPHKFAWFNGDPENYNHLLSGKKINESVKYGGLIEVIVDDMRIVYGDGVGLRYYYPKEKLPNKHQMLIQFDDGSSFVASVQMYGGMWCFKKGEFDNKYYAIAKDKPSPLTDNFNEEYFDGLLLDDSLQNKSVKYFLATEQRIPGLGNGVLQDILFNAKIHPKRKIHTLSDEEKEKLFKSTKETLMEMTLCGGRDTEKDIYGSNGSYKTKMSKKTLNQPCLHCGDSIVKKNYLGGSIYYCETCQRD